MVFKLRFSFIVRVDAVYFAYFECISKLAYNCSLLHCSSLFSTALLCPVLFRGSLRGEQVAIVDSGLNSQDASYDAAQIEKREQVRLRLSEAEWGETEAEWSRVG